MLKRFTNPHTRESCAAQQCVALSSFRGFTIIELMIVVVVIAVLATIAYPSFFSQVRKSRRSEAVATTSQVQQAQERWRASCTTYASLIPTANVGTCDTATSGLGISAATGARYTYALSGTSANGYTLTATAVPGSSQAADSSQGQSCSTLTVTVTNGNSARTPAACWSN